MIAVEAYLIPGFMVGVEFPHIEDMPEDVQFTFVLDLFIVRFILSWLK